MRHLIEAIAAVDEANGHDPNELDGKPLAQLQGQRASFWLSKLHPDASDELQVAVRSHHLHRWQVVRSDFPEGRSGYLRWRKENKAHQAASVAKILVAHGWSDTSTARVQELLLRKRLQTDSEVQALEDAACLVFVETQFDPMTERLDHGHMVNVVTKTLKKMSGPAIALAAQQPLSPASQLVLADAVAQLQTAGV